MPKKPTKAELSRIEMERRESIPPEYLTGYCESCAEWYEWDKTWDSELCPKCGHRPSSRIGYQTTTQRTWNPFINRPKIKIRRVILDE